MIKIIAVLVLAVMCYLITENLTMMYSTPQEFFMWGWISSFSTGLFVNWFVKMINNEE